MSKPVALVNIGEKGYLSLDLAAVGQGGHSSMPPRQTSINIIAAAITKLEANPFPDRLEGCMTSDGKYLLFSRSGDIFWVKAEVIDTLR